MTRNTIDTLLLDVTLQGDGCWSIARRPNNRGYVFVAFQGRPVALHRLLYEHFRQPIPPGLVMDHSCRNKACCNPDHVRPVSQRENILRGDSMAARHAGKTHCLKGHPFSPENTRLNVRGERVCKRCDSDRTQRYKARMKGA